MNIFYLAEALHYKNSLGDGWDWFLNEDAKSVHIERHWKDGKLHGIEREWDDDDRLYPDFPQFYVNGLKVDKNEYILVCESDNTLPKYSPEDNNPARTFPDELRPYLKHCK